MSNLVYKHDKLIQGDFLDCYLTLGSILLVMVVLYESYIILPDLCLLVCFLFVHLELGPDGHLSNFAHFENCTFTGNTAEISGAAIGFTSDLIHVFQNVENTQAFEIESW